MLNSAERRSLVEELDRLKFEESPPTKPTYSEVLIAGRPRLPTHQSAEATVPPAAENSEPFAVQPVVVKPAGGDAKPAVGDAEPAVEDVKSAAVRPVVKPAGGDAKPAVGDAKSAVEDIKSAAVRPVVKPAVSYAKPAVGDAEPAVEGIKSAAGETKAAFGHVKPSIEDLKSATVRPAIKPAAGPNNLNGKKSVNWGDLISDEESADGDH